MPTVSASFWMVLPVVLPLAGGLLCFLWRQRSLWLPLAFALVNLIVVIRLTRLLLIQGPLHYQIGGWETPLGIVLVLDGPALLMLLLTALCGAGVTCYARGYFAYRISAQKQPGRHERQERFFWPLWLMLLAALNGLFLSGDIFNIYVTLELLSISAVALAALSGKPVAQLASFRYLLASLLGSLSYLLGIFFIYRSHGVLDLGLLRAVVEPGSSMTAGLVLMSCGLLLKSAAFPLHFWLPPAHANALAPVSAILSGLVIKGSLYLLFRFWFDTFASLISPAALNVIGMLGILAVFWGGILALLQQRLKLLVAYSTVSQVGYFLIAFPLAYHDATLSVWTAFLFMILAHGCAKVAMFMAAGTMYLHSGHDRMRDLHGIRLVMPLTVFAYGMAGVNLMGLPPSGGFVGKWLLLTGAFDDGQWWWSVAIMAGGLLAAAYVFRVMSPLFQAPVGASIFDGRPTPALLEWPPLVLSLIALLLGLFAPGIMALLTANGGAVISGGLP
ncbi:MAG: oxidoreductase [Desulfobulbaceae bacterium]|uniref:Oxidoreductase n=1 Tax=Candidatus Desulfatifera sulfidica TaxID=2841691 RepID=A0A8J6N793_9BACT|nr:oxidoreductase [Candidatus Desulfatifera sulfidica]